MKKIKSLSDRIAERIQSRIRSTSAPEKNLALIIALKKDILEALEDGWTIKTVWNQLHDEGKIDFSYQTFRKYVVRLNKVKTEIRGNEAEKSTHPQEDRRAGRAKHQIAGFSYDPTPRKEDLI